MINQKVLAKLYLQITSSGEYARYSFKSSLYMISKLELNLNFHKPILYLCKQEKKIKEVQDHVAKI